MATGGGVRVRSLDLDGCLVILVAHTPQEGPETETIRLCAAFSRVEGVTVVVHSQARTRSRQCNARRTLDASAKDALQG